MLVDLRIVFATPLSSVREALARVGWQGDPPGVDGDGFAHVDVLLEVEDVSRAMEKMRTFLELTQLEVQSIMLFDDRINDDEMLVFRSGSNPTHIG
jgi:hypothetical protein